MDLFEKRKVQGLPINPPFFYGWIIVAVAAMGLFFSGPGQTYAISVYINSYINDNIQGELGLKRQLVIEDGELVDVLDIDITTNDAFL